MSEKIGRNDLCTCGSGKKYKQCCLTKQRPGQPRKFTAKILNAKPVPRSEGVEAAPAPIGPDLIARAYAPVTEKPESNPT